MLLFGLVWQDLWGVWAGGEGLFFFFFGGGGLGGFGGGGGFGGFWVPFGNHPRETQLKRQRAC